MIALNEELSRIAIGRARHFRNLTVFPLLRQDGAGAPGYLLADDAVGRGVARVTELDGGGSVPELRFENSAEVPVLLVDGEELVGAKQNRALNLTILAPAKSVTVIPVSCVEAGRWHMESDEFRPAAHVMYSKARAARAGQVTASMRAGGPPRSDQSAVWGDIARKASRMAAPSPTQAMSAMYERHAVGVEEYVRALGGAEPFCGAIFALAGRPYGLDLFDSDRTMSSFFPKLLRSYALDALDGSSEGAEPAEEGAVREFLKAVGGTPVLTQPAVGLGKDVRIASPTISGAALWAEGRYVHVCAFAGGSNGSDGELHARMTRPSRRRFR